MPPNTEHACMLWLMGSSRIGRRPKNVNTTHIWKHGTASRRMSQNYLYAFLARITRHIALNCCRDRARLKRSAFLCELSREMEACIPSPDDMDSRIDDMMLREILNGFLGGLPEETRNLFIRRYWYLDSIADIAERFALSESKVKTTLFRCRRQLREHLEKGGYKI